MGTWRILAVHKPTHGLTAIGQDAGRGSQMGSRGPLGDGWQYLDVFGHIGGH